MAGDEIRPQGTEGKSLPTSSSDRNRSLDEAQEQERDEGETDIESRRRESARLRTELYGSQTIEIGTEIRKIGFRQRFYEAVREGELNMVKRLLETDINLLGTRFTAFEDNAFQVAVVAGQRDILRELMKNVSDHGILKSKISYGETILTLAVAEGSIGIVEELLRKCVGLVDIPDGNGDLPVTVAALFGKKEIVTLLLDLTLEMFKSNPSYGGAKEEEEDVAMTNSTQSSQDDGDFKALKSVHDYSSLWT